MKKQLFKRSFLASFVSLLGSYILWLGLGVFALAIDNTSGAFIIMGYMIISFIVGYKTCKGFISSLSEGIILSIITFFIALFIGPFVAPVTIYKKVRPYAFIGFATKIVNEAGAEEKNELYNDLIFVEEWRKTLTGEEWLASMDNRPSDDDVRMRLTGYGCKTYEDAISLLEVADFI